MAESCLCLLAAAVFAAVRCFFARGLWGARPACSPNPDVYRFQSLTARVFAQGMDHNLDLAFSEKLLSKFRSNVHGTMTVFVDMTEDDGYRCSMLGQPEIMFFQQLSPWFSWPFLLVKVVY